jgi:bifunctional non-homologous end joining protein LigD
MDTAGSLRHYKAKRDFSKTAEPAGAKPKTGGNRFVVQKHAATRLHYDFRLELDGVLKSWAVTKGPSLDPRDRRLAVEVEDHPIEYREFEGTIPKGQYGGGTVMLWDRGTWQPIEDPHKGLKKGHLLFRLDGERMKGEWHLVRMKGRPGERRTNWLLIKGRDEFASESDGLTEEFNTSIKTRRSMGAIAEGEDAWISNRSGTNKVGAIKIKKPRAPRVRGLGKLPRFQSLELATLVEEVPEGDAWLHEMKYDGYRCLAAVDGANITLWTRNEQDWTDRFAKLVAPIASLGIKNALIDGEVVVLDEQGKSSFAKLQNAMHTGRDLTYFAFDLLSENGEDLTKRPLVERKKRLKALIGNGNAKVHYSEHVIGNGKALFDEVCRKGFEGIVSKRADSRYRPGRARDWLKVKCSQRQEFVIGGWQESERRHGFRSLLLGFHDNGDFTYAGKVGTGFGEEVLKSLGAKLMKREIDKSPFTAGPKPEKKSVHWVKPELVAEIAYTEFTEDGHLRHPSFLGLREDKPARDVGREKPIDPPSEKPARKDPPATNKPKKDPPPRNPYPRKADEDRTEGVRITHPEKVLYPEMGLTKRDLIEYYRAVEKLILPHVVGRLVSLVRCPQGGGHKCFFQKHATDGFPDAFKPLKVKEQKGGTAEYLHIDDLRGLIAGVQIGTLEFHVWGSQIDDIEKPTRLVFDFDPDPSVDFTQVKKAAVELRDFLAELGLRTFPLITGGKGVHVVAPIAPRAEWKQAKAFCKAIASAMETANPGRYVTNMAKAKRKGRIFVDYLRNDRGSTAIAPYSTRAKPGATVAVPLSWDELAKCKSADAFDVETMMDRAEKLRSDPWKGFFEIRQSLTKALLTGARVEN